MSNIVKWGLLAAAVVALVALIVALPFNDYISSSNFSEAVNVIINYLGKYLKFGRALLNNFLNTWGRTALTGLIAYSFTKFFITLSIKVGSWVYHFVFRG